MKFMTFISFIFTSLFILFLNAFPNYYAYLKTPTNMSFSGQASWFDPWDINVYVAAINWGQGNGVLFQNTYTTITQAVVFYYPFYTILGTFFSSVSPYLLFHLASIVVGVILLVIIWQLSKIFLNSNTQSLTALFLTSLGGGVGWLFFPNLQFSDLFMTGFTFTSHFQRPHEALGIIFYLLSLVLFYLATIKKSFFLNFTSLISLIALIFFYPFYLLSYFLIAGSYSLVLFLQTQNKLSPRSEDRGFKFLSNDNKKPFLYLLINIVISVPVFLTYYFHLNSNPEFANVLSQKLSNQEIPQVILGYGILFPLLLYQLKNPQKDKRFFFLNIWFFVGFLLSFLPFGFARFYLRTLFFPAILLILLNLDLFSQKIKLSKNIILVVLLVTIPISSLYIFYKRIEETGKQNPWFYLTQAEREATNFLNNPGFQNKGVLASYTLGNYIPANTKTKVYFGHLLQTARIEEKINNLTKFYANAFTDEEAKEFLSNANIQHIYWGKEEQEITFKYSQEKGLKYTFLKPAFQKDKIVIFSY